VTREELQAKTVAELKQMAAELGLEVKAMKKDELVALVFDAKIKADRCPTRSKAVGDLIRASLVQTEWRAGDQVAGAIVLVYDHHKRDILKRLTDLQHDCHDAIISTQHIHLDHDNCLEIVAVRGKPAVIDAIVKRLKSVKGMKHGSLAAGTTGRSLP
jgi:CopG family nickel-responsive transcriptional regulator